WAGAVASSAKATRTELSSVFMGFPLSGLDDHRTPPGFALLAARAKRYHGPFPQDRGEPGRLTCIGTSRDFCHETPDPRPHSGRLLPHDCLGGRGGRRGGRLHRAAGRPHPDPLLPATVSLER